MAQLIFKRPFDSRMEAIKFEAKLKRLRNKAYTLKEYRQYFIRDVAQPG